MEETQLVKHNNKIYLIFLSVFLIIFILSGIFLWLSSSKKEKKEEISTIIPSPNVISPSPNSPNTASYFLNLQPASGVTRFSKGEPIEIKVVASSGEEEIVGWDLLVSYDKTAFDFVKATSLLPDFKIYSFNQKNHLSLTAVKSIQSNTSTFFNNTAVASLIFQAKKTGQFILEAKETVGKEKTQLVNNSTKRLIPRLNQIALEIY